MIAINMPEDRGSERTFGAIEGAIVWCEDQTSQWRSIFRQVKTANEQDVASLLRLIAAWQETGLTLRKNRVDYGKKEFHRVTGNELIATDSPFGEALKYVSDVAGVRAANIALVYSGYYDLDDTIDWENPDSTTAAFLFTTALNENSGIQHNHASENLDRSVRDAFSKLKEFSESLANSTASFEKTNALTVKNQGIVKRDIESGQELVKGLISDAERSLSSLSDLATETRMTLEEEFAAAREKSKSDLDAWSTAHREQARLQHPATLWAERAREHKRSTSIRGAITIVVALAGLIIGALIARFAFQQASTLYAGFVQPATGRAATFSAATLKPTFHFSLITAASVTLVYLTLFLWLIRVLVRGRDTEHHLAIDAEARSAMTETYLGLVREGAASETERALVLAALFRPVIDGMVKDDGPPAISPTALLTSFATGSK